MILYKKYVEYAKEKTFQTCVFMIALEHVVSTADEVAYVATTPNLCQIALIEIYKTETFVVAYIPIQQKNIPPENQRWNALFFGTYREAQRFYFDIFLTWARQTGNTIDSLSIDNNVQHDPDENGLYAFIRHEQSVPVGERLVLLKALEERQPFLCEVNVTEAIRRVFVRT